ncbi:MAG: hypothetical protein ACXQS2_05035 [Methermicoccaceae archaeon]
MEIRIDDYPTGLGIRALMRDLILVIVLAFSIMMGGYGIKYIIAFHQLPLEPSYLMFLASILFVLCATALQRYRRMLPHEAIIGGSLLTAIAILLLILVVGGIEYAWFVYEVSVAQNAAYIALADTNGITGITTKRSLMAFLGVSLVAATTIYLVVASKISEAMER